MKVKELIKLLEQENMESDVILQKDSEGNGYSPLYGVDGDAVYVSETNWGGIVYSLEWNADDADMNEDDWEKIKKMPKCVILFPTN